VTDIKSNREQPHRLLLCYKNRQSISSAVLVFSLRKNKEVQSLEFLPAFSAEIGKAIGCEYSPDLKAFAVAFSSGEIHIYKVQDKKLSGVLRPLLKLELDNSSPIQLASL